MRYRIEWTVGISMFLAFFLWACDDNANTPENREACPPTQATCCPKGASKCSIEEMLEYGACTTIDSELYDAATHTCMPNSHCVQVDSKQFECKEPCKEGTSLCRVQERDLCVDFLRDANNCGGCVSARAGKKCQNSEWCNNGVCEERLQDDCKSGEMTCNNRGVPLLCVLGEWIEQETCSALQTCVNGSCQELDTDCEPGDSHCAVIAQDSVLRQCNENGEWEILKCNEQKPQALCRESQGKAACVPKVCEENAKICEENILKQCSENAWLETPCTGSTPVCHFNACVECTEDEHCGGIKKCDKVFFECYTQAQKCKPMESYCEKDRFLQCQDDGLTWKTTNCSGETPICHEGNGCERCIYNEDCQALSDIYMECQTWSGECVLPNFDEVKTQSLQGRTLYGTVRFTGGDAMAELPTFIKAQVACNDAKNKIPLSQWKVFADAEFTQKTGLYNRLFEFKAVISNPQSIHCLYRFSNDYGVTWTYASRINQTLWDTMEFKPSQHDSHAFLVPGTHDFPWPHVEDFEQISNVSQSYTTENNYTGRVAQIQTVGRTALDDFVIDGKGVMFRGSHTPSENQHISAKASTGVGTVAIDYRSAYKAEGTRNITIRVNGAPCLSHDFEQNDDIHTAFCEEVNAEGEIEILVRQEGEKLTRQITIDNLRWTGYP